MKILNQALKIYKSNLKRWSIQNKNIRKVMKIIKQKIPDYTPDNYKINIFKFPENFNKQTQLNNQNNLENHNFTLQKQSTNNIEAEIKKLQDLQTIFQQTDKKKHNEILGFQIEKVFGININNIKNIFLYHSDNNATGKSEKIIYVVNKLIVIYYTRLKKQEYYLSHQNQITAICLSNKNLIASCDWTNNYSTIRLWDIHSKEDLIIFNNNHKNSIQCVEFFDDDNKIISISHENFMEEFSFVYIHSLENLNVLFSFRRDGLVFQIYALKKLNNQIDKAILICKNKISILKEIKTEVDFSYETVQIDLSKIQGQNNLNCLEIIRNEKQDQFFLTGHQNGLLLKWKDFQKKNQLGEIYENLDKQNQYMDVIKQYKYPIKAITQNDIGVIVLLGSCKIQIWNNDMTSRIRKLDFEKRKPFNEDFQSFIFIKGFNNKLMIMTDLGDLFIYKLCFEIQKHTQKKQLKHKNQRIQSLFRLTINKPIFQVKENQELEKFYLYLVQNQKEIWIINLNENNFCNKLTFNNQIICFDCQSYNDETSFVVILENNQIYHLVMKEFNNTYTTELQENIQLDQDFIVNQCLITQNKKKIVMLIDENKICWFEKSNDLFFKQSNMKTSHYQGFKDKITNIKDVDELESTCLLVNTSSNRLLITNYISHNNFIEFVNKENLKHIELNFNENGQTKKFIYYQDTASFMNHENTILYFPNQNYIKEFTFKTVNFFLYNVQNFYYNQKTNLLISFENNCIIKSKAILQKKQLPQTLQKNKNLDLQYQKNLLTTEQNESYFNSVAEYNFKNLNAQNNKSISQKQENQYELTNDQTYLIQRQPPVSLNIQRVYGLNSQQTINSVLYCYDFREKITQQDEYYQKTIQLEKNKQLLKNRQNSIQFTFNDRDNDDHKYCNRQVLYTISNKIILYEPIKKQQKFYDKHIGQITALTLNQNKKIVASVEQKGFNSCCVHVWSIKGQIKLNEFKLKNVYKIIQIQFSKDDKYILMMGTQDVSQSSILVIDWQQKKLIVNSVISDKIFSNLLNNRYNQNEFCIAGVESIIQYKIQGNYLLIQQSIELNEYFEDSDKQKKIIVSVLNYYYYFLGNTIDYDLLIGTQCGEIGLLTFGKYQRIKEKAHDGQINIMKITNLFSQATTIITAGEDQKIKFWNAKLEFLECIDLTTDQINKQPINGSAVSIDFFACYHNSGISSNKKQIKNCRKSINILICTKLNEIKEIQVSTDYKQMRSKIDDNQTDSIKNDNIINQQRSVKTLVTDEKFDFQHLPNLLQFNYNFSNQTNTIIKYYENKNILIICSIQELIIWDTNLHNILYQKFYKNAILDFALIQSRDMLVIYANDNTVKVYHFTINQIKKIHKAKKIFEQQIKLKYKIYKVQFQGELITNMFIFFQPVEENKDMKIKILKLNIQIEDQQISIQEQSYIYKKLIQDLKQKQILQQKKHQLQLNNIQLDNQENVFNFTFRDNINCGKQYYFLHFNLQKEQFYIEQTVENLPFELKILENPFEVNTIQTNIEYQENDYQCIKIRKNFNVTCFQRFNQYIIFGTKEGFIILCKNPQINSFNNLKLQGKLINSQSCSIQNIILSEQNKTLFIVSNNSQCVIQYSIDEIDQKNEYDYLLYPVKSQNDFFCQNVNKDQFQKILKSNFGKRDVIQQNIQVTQQSEYFNFQIKKIIGRKALFTQNCMEISGNQLIYSIGNVLCTINLSDLVQQNINNISKDQKYQENQFRDLKSIEIQQQFLRLNLQQRQNKQSYEISTFCINKQKTQICSGTMEEQSNLYFWEIQSLQFYGQISLPTIQKVQYICYSDNSEFLVCVGLCKDYFQNIFFISLQNDAQIIAQTTFRYGSSQKIRGIQFKPNRNYTFYTYGKQHLNKWNCNSDTLYPKQIQIFKKKQQENLKNQKSKQDLNQQEVILSQKENITFLSLIFIQENVFITGTDEGDLYVWKNSQIITYNYRQNCGKSNAILSMCLKPSYEEGKYTFITGGADGEITIWTCSLQKGAESIELISSPNLKNNYLVQSLQFYKEFMIAGFDNGDLYLIKEQPQDMQNQVLNDNTQKDKAFCIFKFNDQDEPKFIEFSKNNKLIFSITKNGNFCAYLFKNLISVYEKEFCQKVIMMKLFTQKQLLLIVFEKTIEFYDISKIDSEQDMNEKFQKVDFESYQNEQPISNIQVSLDEKMIAISYRADPLVNSKHYPYIQIMSLSLQDKTIQQLKTLDKINSEIQILDFSTDNQILMYVTEEGKIFYLTLFDFKEKQGNNYENIEWIEDGLQYSNERLQLQMFYNENNRILKILKYDEKTLFVGDTQGFVKVYKIDKQQPKLLNVLDLHQSQINNIKISDNKKYLATSSRTDKSTVIWCINNIKQVKLITFVSFKYIMRISNLS